jgi:hypothetical protein
MKIFLPFFFTCILLSAFSQVPAQQTSATFSSNTATMLKPRVSTFNCTVSNGRAFLHWSLANNQEADQVEVEYSPDAKSFTMAALVFATEKADKDDYYFYEKARKGLSFYRLKILNKDRTILYSDIVSP